MARSHLVPLPAAWVEALSGSLGAPEPPVHRAAVAAAAVLQVPALDKALLALADRPAEPPDLRVEALRAALPRHRDLSAAAFELLLARLGAKDRPLEVLTAAEVAGRARLDDDRRVRLLAAVRGDALIAPAVLGPAFAGPLGDRAAAAWLDHLGASIRAGWGPPGDELRALLAGIPPALGDRRADLERLAAEAHLNRRARLAELEPLLTGGDPGRGRAVFFGTKVGCATCHRIGDAGGRIGPDLTRIGAVRSGPDLLESIAWPSSTFAQGYEPYAVATVDGRVLVGVIVRRDAAVLILRDASGAETRLRRDEVEGLRRSGTSLMPDGLARALTRQELRDLLAFLRSQD
jgi:putative heme-binding domain-containing protein